ncbi:hypothetical protein AGABI1DRAFT_121932 [Agaricus bisporus var. burnettii JB137-S8]|uniref:Uncharacterized protein n=1 Tax=Agaricus bisporus var. burnettii (strain JB137-S8 / ATCC MYA-4627 / FGSC 10392) TaxID=597362 RepID=K5VSS7_AGABU|nr:uncharacterized protein AGABI1DRAFT_121932 [Agaricus bisporus var. burnettii JB137-S8]EKM77514.1 hypothetical protein AGABI1DRAFT_121932 [Agaricus bisporus var. burnettii JB137-S8]
MEWDSLSEEDQIKQQEEWIKFLNNPNTISQFSEACKNIGQTAVAIDDDFRTVKNGFAELVKKHGEYFPDVEKVYARRWNELKARWNGESGILWSSRELAARTAAALSDYGLNLIIVQKIACKGDLEGARAELKQYVKRHPVHVSNQVADDFIILKNDIRDFSKAFTKYVEEQKQKASEDAKKYEAEIKQFQAEVDSLDRKVRSAVIALGCTWLFGILSTVPAGFLLTYIAQRREAKAKLEQAKANLALTVKKQQALAGMQTNFAHLKPNIDDICTKLGVFASIWAFATEQSIEIDSALDEGIKVITRKKFKVKLEFLIKQIEPLREGMRQYSTQITTSQAASSVE